MYVGAELDNKIRAFLEDRALAHPDLDLRHTAQFHSEAKQGLPIVFKKLIDSYTQSRKSLTAK